MYLSAQEAAKELARRQRDPRIKQRVLDFVGGSLPKGFPSYPVAIFPRQMASCRYEDIAFQEAACRIDLEPWAPTYLQDRYTSSNPDKVNYLRFRVLKDAVRQQMAKVKLVEDINEVDRARTPLGDILTNRISEDGAALGLHQVHLAMRRRALQYPDLTFDISSWFATQAARAGAPHEARSLCRYYYPANLAQFIVHGIMFEDYHNGPNTASLNKFVQDNVEPALKILGREIGLPPLIVQFSWQKGFDLYPPEVMGAIPTRPPSPRFNRCVTV